MGSSQKMVFANRIKRPMFYCLFNTPLGAMIGCASDEGVVMLLFENEAREYMQHLSVDFVMSKNGILYNLESQLADYFKGTLHEFSVGMDMQVTPYQQKVFEIVKKIPFGSTQTYKALAAEVGDINGTRAVASANAHNNVLLLIPCHRVVGTGNKLTGYRGGIDKKRWLLNFENENTTTRKVDRLF